MSKNGIAIKIEGLFWDYNVVNWRFTYSQAGTLWYRKCSKSRVFLKYQTQFVVVVKVEFF